MNPAAADSSGTSICGHPPIVLTAGVTTFVDLRTKDEGPDYGEALRVVQASLQQQQIWFLAQLRTFYLFEEEEVSQHQQCGELHWDY